ncbi:hypothetical protein J3458_017288 [Metarhizium acridum]|uniref:uncharacterized protein n=1 Tax=Metarhizium acridum TaxID=92637 RepID=UPI001C6B9DB7|nr:hypothetical protein J3458_017288 [Metarhizium acridum]
MLKHGNFWSPPRLDFATPPLPPYSGWHPQLQPTGPTQPPWGLDDRGKLKSPVLSTRVATTVELFYSGSAKADGSLRNVVHHSLHITVARRRCQRVTANGNGYAVPRRLLVTPAPQVWYSV